METNPLTTQEQNNLSPDLNIEQAQDKKNSLDQITAYRGETVTRRTSAPMTPVTLAELVNQIKNDPTISKTVDEIRALGATMTGDPDKDKPIKDAQNKLKKEKLPYITLGRFRDNYLRNESLIESQYEIQDIDELGSKYAEVRTKLLSDPQVFILFKSPRGNGLKVIRQYDHPISNAERYKELHKHYGEDLAQRYSITVDTTHDAARACFMSSDPDIYFNPNHQLLQTDIVIAAQPQSKKKKESQERQELFSILLGVSENRNTALTKIIGMWLDRGYDEDFIQKFAETWNKQNQPPLPDQEVQDTVTKLCKAYGDPENLDRDFQTIRNNLKGKKADDVIVARTLFRWLRHNQRAEYFRDENDVHYIYSGDRLIPMHEKNPDFNALLLSTANITTADKFGKVTVQVMNASAHIEGKRIQRSTWLESRIERFTIFLNLKNPQNEILKITPQGCELIQNGYNEDGVFMLNCTEDKLKPIQFTQMDDETLKDALDRGYDLVARHIPCSDNERWFAYGWRLAYPLYDFTSKHITVRAQGKSAAGKSTACDVLALSLYGESNQSISTTASLYRDAAVNPLIIEDNLENKRFYNDEGHGQFYLTAATGGMKQKSSQATDSGITIERIRALVMCNGIESIAKSEQTNRMMIIHCDKNAHNSEFTDAVYLDIRTHRDQMLSANFILTQQVLKRIEQGDWHLVQKELAKNYPNHAKSRMFEHIALIILYLEEHFKATGLPKDVDQIVKDWMKNQTESAFEEIVQSDPIIHALDIIRDSAWKQFKFDNIDSADEEVAKRRVQVIKLDVETLLLTVKYSINEFSITGMSGQLLGAFSKAFQVHLGKPFPIQNGRILSQRITEIVDEAKQHGYTLTKEFNAHDKQINYTFTWQQPGSEEQK